LNPARRAEVDAVRLIWRAEDDATARLVDHGVWSRVKSLRRSQAEFAGMMVCSGCTIPENGPSVSRDAVNLGYAGLAR
jgi:molybdate-binding protein